MSLKAAHSYPQTKQSAAPVVAKKQKFEFVEVMEQDF